MLAITLSVSLFMCAACSSPCDASSFLRSSTSDEEEEPAANAQKKKQHGVRTTVCMIQKMKSKLYQVKFHTEARKSGTMARAFINEDCGKETWRMFLETKVERRQQKDMKKTEEKSAHLRLTPP